MKVFSKIVSAHDCLGEYVEVTFTPLFDAVYEFCWGSCACLACYTGFLVYYDLALEIFGLEAGDSFFVVVNFE